jgi:hypothetical protein
MLGCSRPNATPHARDRSEKEYCAKQSERKKQLMVLKFEQPWSVGGPVESGL